ncbi:MAG: Asp-tRNA(Asn)/Glu-tRNA(Gln) amidotransferase subunit GatC [Rickettsiaceae bacterium]|nr:Asp-tRNA(Asn)/Glu-tRNA(Gln) amidotransferase subunit GatC [Rickettsiaceae bacterium]
MTNILEIRKLQNLVKIKCSAEEEENFVKQFDTVLEMINKLHAINCEGIEPLYSVSELNQRLVADEVLTGDIAEDLFTNVPKEGRELAKEIKCFIVPKVME